MKNILDSWVSLRVEPGLDRVYMDESGDRPCLVVPPDLEIRGKDAVSDAIEQESWVPIWDQFKTYGLKHPNHKNWHQGQEEGKCNQYILGPSPYFNQSGLYVCTLEEAHEGNHQCGEMSWSDDEADEVNHKWWMKASDAYERAARNSEDEGCA